MIRHRSTGWRALSGLAALACVGMQPSSAQEPAETPAETPDDTLTLEGLEWQLGSNGGNVAWSDAHEYCESLEHAGFDDWRLPTLAELERLHDPDEESGLPAPIELDDCCAWSSTNLVEQPAEAKGSLPDPTNDPADYYWGFLFSSGVRYYSFGRFPDGLAMCVREP